MSFRAPETRDGEGHAKERLRLFFAVWLDTDDAEAAMWAVLEADRRERNDDRRRARDGRPLAKRDPVVAAVLAAATKQTGVPLEDIQRSRTRRAVRARDAAVRALRDQGYSYRAISAALDRRAPSTVLQALARAAGRRDTVALAELVRRRAKRAAYRKAA